MKRLEGKYAMITGGSQGLGRQLAIDFVRRSVISLLLGVLNH
jgi:NAD(P)-dependent dehydrogenase (short-subunit alcohol dehydrogenase family)